MTTIAIVPENPGVPAAGFRAIAGSQQAVGQTAGQALDALNRQLDEKENGTLVVVQHQRPDRFFTAEQQGKLEQLMAAWRSARDGGQGWSPDQQAELDALIQAELRAAS